VLLEVPATDEWMQNVAAELRHSETAFVLPRADDGYQLRWFTPAAEVRLCGHATLAAAHVLAGRGRPAPFAFHTHSGVLTAAVDAGEVTLDFPAQPPTPTEQPAGLVEALGAEVRAIYSNGIDVLVEVADESAVHEVAPDISALRAVDCRGVIVTAPADADRQGVDFVSRFFAPRVGVDEDPVTGSAHCALAPFWAARLGRDELVGVQLSARGGRIAVELRGERVLLRGRAVTVLAGSLLG
jgi:PhzF family phenazine biosynthesis protein